MANQITSLQNWCSRVNAWHCCLVGFGFQEYHEAARAMRSEGFHQILQKLWGSPEERFQQSVTLSSTKVATGPGWGAIALSGPRPIAPFGPNRPRLRHRAPIGARPSRALVPSWHRLVLLQIQLQSALSYNIGATGRSGPDGTVGPDRTPIAPSGPDHAPIAPSGPDCAVGP